MQLIGGCGDIEAVIDDRGQVAQLSKLHMRTRPVSNIN